MDNIVNVIDIEATCWEDSRQQPKGEVSEIIEIGIVPIELGALRVVHPSRSILVRPIASRVSEFCTRLTGHTQAELVEKGMTFSDALNVLREDYAASDRTWVSWGAYDKNMFAKQCARLGYEYPFPAYESGHVNIKERFAKIMGAKPCGMDTALNILKMPLLGRHHNGADDAYNIAQITLELIRRTRAMNNGWQ